MPTKIEFTFNWREDDIFTCVCGDCLNEFAVPGVSEEFKPNFCPYCGESFRDTVEYSDNP